MGLGMGNMSSAENEGLSRKSMQTEKNVYRVALVRKFRIFLQRGHPGLKVTDDVFSPRKGKRGEGYICFHNIEELSEEAVKQNVTVVFSLES